MLVPIVLQIFFDDSVRNIQSVKWTDLTQYWLASFIHLDRMWTVCGFDFQMIWAFFYLICGSRWILHRELKKQTMHEKTSTTSGNIVWTIGRGGCPIPTQGCDEDTSYYLGFQRNCPSRKGMKPLTWEVVPFCYFVILQCMYLVF